MPLKFATSPPGGKDVVIKGLQDVAGASSHVHAAIWATGAAGPQVADPYAIYSLQLGDILLNGLDEAHLIGWRYLIVAGQHVVQAAEIYTPPKDGVLQLNCLTTGHDQEMADVLAKAEGLSEVAQGDYEIRALRVPSLYLTALWLKDLQANRDLFLAVPPSVHPPFNAHDVYEKDKFLELLKSAAAKRVRELNST